MIMDFFFNAKTGVRNTLAAVWTTFAIVYILFITFHDIPENNIRFADTILGFLLGTVVATIINFFFGSSKGSEEKTQILNDNAKANP